MTPGRKRLTDTDIDRIEHEIGFSCADEDDLYALVQEIRDRRELYRRHAPATTNDLTAEELDQLDGLVEESSPLPWGTRTVGSGARPAVLYAYVTDATGTYAVLERTNGGRVSDVYLVAAACTALPRLVAEVRRSRHTASIPLRAVEEISA